MADKKISALTGATTPLAGTEVLPIVQGSATVKVSVADLTAGRAVAMAGGSFTDNITQSTAAKGVNFTANTPAAGMTSQLLNWYEEGTWTPVISSNGSGSPTFTATTQSGRYTRIGRQVTVICEYVYTDRGTVGGSYAFMTGLPFTSNGKSFVDIAIQQTAPDVSLYTAYLAGSSTTIQFWKNNYPGAAGAMLGTDFPLAGSVVFCMTYFA